MIYNFSEICFFWKDCFKLDIVNNDYMGPDPESVISYFIGLNND